MYNETLKQTSVFKQLNIPLTFLTSQAIWTDVTVLGVFKVPSS